MPSGFSVSLKPAYVSSASAFLGELAHRGDRDRRADESPIGDRPTVPVEREPRAFVVAGIGAEVDARSAAGLGGDDRDHLLAPLGEGLRVRARGRKLLLQRHGEQQ
jgi:hypothetical protein